MGDYAGQEGGVRGLHGGGSGRGVHPQGVSFFFCIHLKKLF
jgi:hypothetical protein